MNSKTKAEDLMKDIPVVYLALKDKKTPFSAKLVAFLIVVYALSPVDLIPDFIPFLGYLDDIIILPALILIMINLIPQDIWDLCRKEATGMVMEKKWCYVSPIILIWMVLIVLLIKWIYGII